MVRLPLLPADSGSRAWQFAFRDEIVSASGAHDLAFFPDNRSGTKHRSFGDLITSGHFVSLDAKLAAALSNTTTGESGRQVDNIK